MKKAIIVVLFFSIWPYTVLGDYWHTDSDEGYSDPSASGGSTTGGFSFGGSTSSGAPPSVSEPEIQPPDTPSETIQTPTRPLWLTEEFKKRDKYRLYLSEIKNKRNCNSSEGYWYKKSKRCVPWSDRPRSGVGGGSSTPKVFEAIQPVSTGLPASIDYPRNSAGVAVQGFPSVKGAGDFLYEAYSSSPGISEQSLSPTECVFNKETKSVECTKTICSSSITSYKRINPKTGKPYIPAPNISWGWGTTGSSGSTR